MVFSRTTSIHKGIASALFGRIPRKGIQMYNVRLSFAIASMLVTLVLVGFANGQDRSTTATSPAQSGASAPGSADRMAGMGETQTFTGVLLDANCGELRNMNSTTGMTGTAVTPGTAGVGTIQDSSGIARPGAPGPGGAAEDPIAGTGPAKAGQTDAAKAVDETVAGGRATAAAGARDTGMSRADTLAQFRNCFATSNTSSYALYSEGRIIHLDPESSSQVRQHLQGENQSADRAHVQVQGQLQLKVHSVQPMRTAN